MPRSPPYPYLFLSQPHKQTSILSGRCTVGFRVPILFLQQLSPSGSGVRCPQPPGSGKRVQSYTGSWWSPGRHTSQESGFSIRPSEKQKEHSRSQSSSKHPPRIWSWLGRSSHSSICMAMEKIVMWYLSSED